MAITNHERVGKALELLRVGLTPFVEREFKAKYGDGWAFEVKDVLSDTRLGSGKAESLNDVAALLVVMDRKWSDVFRQILGKTERSLVNEILAVRNNSSGAVLQRRRLPRPGLCRPASGRNFSVPGRRS